MRMEAFQIEAREYDVVLGPCPGCESWQLDYTNEIAQEFMTWEPVEVHEFGSEDAIPFGYEPDTSGFHAVVEDLLHEHLEECPHLQRLLGRIDIEPELEPQ